MKNVSKCSPVLTSLHMHSILFLDSHLALNSGPYDGFLFYVII